MTTATKTVVNGYEVEQVDFGSGGNKLGSYCQVNATSWKETNTKGQTTFNFEETNRDQWSVYLKDSSRDVNIQIDLHRKKICYSDANSPTRDLYDVMSSAAVNGWMIAEAMYGSLDGSGAQLGSFFQTGSTDWYERNAQGKKTFSFKETSRDDWSVYLLDASRDVKIQIDVWTKKIFYSDPNAERRELYNVLSVASGNGWMVQEAVYGSGANTIGRFVQDPKGTKDWLETNNDGKFKFVESNRDEWSVYMSDSSRSVKIQIDLWRGKIIYSDAKTSPRDQYDLLYARS